MKIEFWSDVVCPWCGLVRHRLTKVLAAVDFGDQVEVVHRSFQLHPELDRAGVEQRDLFERYGVPKDAGIATIRHIERLAAADGLTPYLALDRTLGPTDHLHELLAHATELGRGEDAWNAAFLQHFGRARKLWTIPAVLEFAADLGLDVAEAQDALRTRRYRGRVAADQQAALALGAHGVPLFRLDGRHLIAGAVDTAVLTDAVRKAWSSAHRDVPIILDGSGATCEPDGCAVPAHEPATTAREIS
ncbi:DsbA family protein [Frankia sp. Mgl5]|uniref:DsbA family oxidoreductase n=1 Tax=Frankia sp. Mgl5 TaxID=2933793 RepID=UPI00200FE340|nr:DsbA family protein [Frankia sp. Mgl5]MCK9928273.1 DsbA family protein [Frankia sp. Mgl5]